MSKLPEFKLQKLKMKMEAAKAKPERPRIGEQLGLEKALVDTQRESSADIKRADQQVNNELSEKWKSKGGGDSGEAFVIGLNRGLQEGSFMDDKKRSKRLTDFIEKTSEMVATQNEQLFKEEKLYNARNSVTPRIMAYLDTYKNMSPNDRKVYLQNSMEEYNKIAGTDYKVVDATGSEPWKIIVSDGMELSPLDFMDFIKMPEEKRMEYYLKSNEVKEYENSLSKQDYLENMNKREINSYRQSKIEDAEIKRKEHQEALQVEKEIFEKNGDKVKFIDNLPPSLAKDAEKHIKEYTEKANQDLAAEKRLQRAVQISKDHPELFGNLNAIISSRYNEDPGYINNILKNKIPEESRDAASELAGIVKNIFTDSVKGIPAKGVNQFIEKKLEGGSPNQRWTAKAFEKVVSEALNEYSDSYNEHKKAADYGSSGLYYRPKAKVRKTEEKQENKINTSPILDKLKSIPGLTREDIDEAERRLRSGQ